jgi:glutaredoxin
VSVEVVMYGGRGCHLCEVAADLLERERARLGFELRHIDITGDPQLEAAYREQIPVVFVDGRKAFKFTVDQAELERRVRAATIHPR